MSKAYISLRTKLAAALCWIGEIPTEDAKAMHPDQVIGLFHFDHYPLAEEHGGPTVHWNLKPRFIKDHRKKTTKDQKFSAKLRRVTAEQEETRRRILAKSGQAEAPPRPKSRLKGRGFQGSRKFNGEVKWRKGQ